MANVRLPRDWKGIKKFLIDHGEAIGAGTFGTMGAVRGARKYDDDQKKKKRSVSQRIAGGITGGALGAFKGYLVGGLPKFMRSMKIGRLPETAPDAHKPIEQQIQTRANELARRFARASSPVDGRPFFPNASDMTKINAAMLAGFADEAEKIAESLVEVE